jgi:hypothetical protein
MKWGSISFTFKAVIQNTAKDKRTLELFDIKQYISFLQAHDTQILNEIVHSFHHNDF